MLCSVELGPAWFYVGGGVVWALQSSASKALDQTSDDPILSPASRPGIGALMLAAPDHIREEEGVESREEMGWRWWWRWRRSWRRWRKQRR